MHKNDSMEVQWMDFLHEYAMEYIYGEISVIEMLMFHIWMLYIQILCEIYKKFNGYLIAQKTCSDGWT